MPKERRDRSASFDKYRASPLRRDSSPSPTDDDMKEWEEARCPVCIEHPHNCILLICSSYENGCRPYMCDTSPRHSNCFDQYRKVSKRRETATAGGATGSAAVNLRERVASESTVANLREEGRFLLANRVSDEDEEKDKPRITCPLCRGYVRKWIVVKGARSFMNSKLRSCSCETCDYSGNYSDLRKHARLVHPEARPSVADPARQVSWRRFEQERDISDLISYMQSFSREADQERDEQIQSIDEDGLAIASFHFRVMLPAPEIRLRWATSSRDGDNNRVPGSISGVQRGVSIDTTGEWGREGMDLVAAGTSAVQRQQRIIGLLATSSATPEIGIRSSTSSRDDDNNRISASIVRVQRDWPQAFGFLPPRRGYSSLSNTSSSDDDIDGVLETIRMMGTASPMPEISVRRRSTYSSDDDSDRILESITGLRTQLPETMMSSSSLSGTSRAGSETGVRRSTPSRVNDRNWEIWMQQMMSRRFDYDGDEENEDGEE